MSTRGELIGINSQILSPSGGNIGIGFAIPANMAHHVFESLISDGRVHRGMLGVTVQPVTADVARSLGLDTVGGALISNVTPKGPAAKAGVQRGDTECLAKIFGFGSAFTRRRLLDNPQVFLVDHDGRLLQGHMVMVPPPA